MKITDPRSERTSERHENILGAFFHALLVTGARSWDEERTMRTALNDVWRAWGPSCIIRPVLIAGQCPDGADAMAERLWRAAGFEVLPFPDDWQTHGRAAGFRRNQDTVDAAVGLRDAGVQVRCATFLDLCRKPNCPQRDQHQLIREPGLPGHFSHGTVHCRRQALAAGIDVVDVVHPALPPF